MFEKLIFLLLPFHTSLISSCTLSRLALTRSPASMRHTLTVVGNAVSIDTTTPTDPLEQYRCAVQHDDLACVKTLLQEKTISVHDKDEHGNTLLHILLERREIAAGIEVIAPFIEELLKAGADINAQNNDGDTPLHYAYHFRQQGLIMLLIEKGARQDIENKRGEKPAAVSTLDKKTTLAQAISTFTVYGDSENEGEIIKNNWYPSYQKLLKKNPKLAHRRYSSERTALHLITQQSDIVPAFIDILIEAGADVNAQDLWKLTPLHNAARYGSFVGVEKLLEHGANPNCVDINNKSPLCCAQEMPNPTHATIRLIALLEKVTDPSLHMHKQPSLRLENQKKHVEDMWLKMTRGYRFYELLGLPLNSSPQEVDEAFNHFIKHSYELKKDPIIAQQIDDLIFYLLGHMR